MTGHASPLTWRPCSSKLEECRRRGRDGADAGCESARTGRPRPTDIVTSPFPGFPTDMQAQMMALLGLADGHVEAVTETIFENRFMHVAELARMGADIPPTGTTAIIRGVPQLPGRARDGLRPARLGGAGAGRRWPREGRTEVSRVYHLDRGYERLEASWRARRPHRAAA